MLKIFLQRHNIPTATYESFSEITLALNAVRQHFRTQANTPIVIKADGLAAGKGVIIAETLSQAEETITDMLSGNAFGEAGHRVIIEEFLEGEEAQLYCNG